MSITIQWVLTGLILLGAVYYVFFRFGWLTAFNVKPPSGGPCGHCTGCDAARNMAKRLADSEKNGPA